MIICLTGFMGCGKSSVGRELSELLCCRFMDLDSVIEAREGRSIPEIFASDGEAAFRLMELEALMHILNRQESSSHTEEGVSEILALGGGTVMTPECAEMVRKHTTCIYLRTGVETLVERLADEADGRPMLQTTSLRGTERRGNLQARIEELMLLRSATYEKTAHVIIDTDGKSIDSISQEIISRTE